MVVAHCVVSHAMSRIDATAIADAISASVGQATKALEGNNTDWQAVLTEEQRELFAGFLALFRELLNVKGDEEERDEVFRRMVLAHGYLRLSTSVALFENRDESAEENLKIVDTAVQDIGYAISPPKRSLRERLGGLFRR